MRTVFGKIAAQYSSWLKKGDKICTQCRKRLNTLSVPAENVEGPVLMSAISVESEPTEELTEEGSTSSLDSLEMMENDVFESPDVELSTLNYTLRSLGQSPLCKRKMSSSKSYVTTKRQKIFTAVTQKLATTSTSSSVMIEESSTNADDIIAGLKEKFKNSQVRSEKVMILTIFGLTWTVRKIMSEFDCSQRMALQAVKPAKESGILTTPNPKNGRPRNKRTCY